MATVYLATDVKHRRKVAIKVLRPEVGYALGPERFLQEIALTANLQHPHILPLYDSGEADGLLYYVMPFVAGESLRRRLDREKRLSIDDALRIVRHVASALDHAHRQGLVHRDVKPENILFHEDEAMVADFGIALAAGAAPGERVTAVGLLVGTPEYMSPEQAAGEQMLDARSDVYSLGCVLYEMLTGQPPFTGPGTQGAQAVIARRFVEPVPSVRSLRPAVPAAVDHALRKALARTPADRFASATAFADALTSPATLRPRERSVAVLPFLSLSADPDNELFADGVMEDVIAQLSKIRDLKVISRTSVMQFRKREQSLREIGAALQAATILEGSVRRVGDRVRIVAQLVDTDTDQHLWGETYDRRLTDIFEIQTDVALHIAVALRAELSPDERTRIRPEPPSDLEAYRLYLQGRHWRNQFSTAGGLKAVQYFQQAIAVDPHYAMAHAGVALAYAELAVDVGGGAMIPDVALVRAREAVSRALAIDGRLGEAHAVLGLLRFVHDYDWAGAEEELKLALELSPGSADTYDHYGWLCASLERYDEAIAMARHAQELDPLAHRSDLASMLLRAGCYEEAAREAARSIEFDSGYPRAHSTLGWAYVKMGKHDEGLAELEEAVRLSPGNTLHLSQLGEAYGLLGQPERAREVLRQLDELSRHRYVAPYHLAYVYAGLGEHDQAIDCLERAYAERAGAVYGIKGSFLFPMLRPHPRFKALLAKMNLA
jgi:serine/threonine-protein kinase